MDGYKYTDRLFHSVFLFISAKQWLNTNIQKRGRNSTDATGSLVLFSEWNTVRGFQFHERFRCLTNCRFWRQPELLGERGKGGGGKRSWDKENHARIKTTSNTWQRGEDRFWYEAMMLELNDQWHFITPPHPTPPHPTHPPTPIHQPSEKKKKKKKNQQQQQQHPRSIIFDSHILKCRCGCRNSTRTVHFDPPYWDKTAWGCQTAWGQITPR